MTTITDVRTIAVTVTDQDAALGVLRRYARLREAARRADQPDHALDRGRAAGRDAHRSRSPPPKARRTSANRHRHPVHRPGRRRPSTPRWRTAASRVGELLRWDGVPPMFTFDDPDGNRFYIVEESMRMTHTGRASTRRSARRCGRAPRRAVGPTS